MAGAVIRHGGGVLCGGGRSVKPGSYLGRWCVCVCVCVCVRGSRDDESQLPRVHLHVVVVRVWVQV